MHLSLKTKFTLATSLLFLAVVALVSGLYLGRLMRQTLRQASDNASFVAQQVYDACDDALKEANERGETPASLAPADVRDYVSRAFDNSSTLNSLIESDMGISPTIYEITISDVNGIVLVSSDATKRGQKLAMRLPLRNLVHAGLFEQLRELYGPAQTFEFSLPFQLGAAPFGDIRVALSSALIRDEITPGLKSAGLWALGLVLLSALLAFLVSASTLAPIGRISAQLDRISAGQFDSEPVVARRDELGIVSTKITGIGKQLRDVREIFSTLREDFDLVMSGLDASLLLFNAEGRAVLASPSLQKFLGRGPEELSGRRVSEIFPEGHPLRTVLRITGEEIEPVSEEEVILDGGSGPQRAGLSVQVIGEHGATMGTLVTLRDVESRARLGSQIEVSERLAALARVTAGVAHEVKNPLNSMRLWLEVLKGNMPAAPEPQQAVNMLDSEIDRLDRAVKTFLNFTKPVQLTLKETDLRALVSEVLDAARPAIAQSSLSLHTAFPPEFPAVYVDRQLIHQAVLNLVLNACDFTPAGGRISVSLRRAGEFAVIAVEDTGKGIAPEDRQKIFQLFFTTRPGGTGIGLANAFRFVQLHNGRIEFESERNRGTVFRVEIPLARPADWTAAKAAMTSEPLAAEKS